MKSAFGILLGGILLFGCRQYALPNTASAVHSEAMVGVTEVNVHESEIGQFVFSVTIRSEDTGCDRYADWWEIVTEDGELLNRRILAHSHVTQQPFTRSGTAISLNKDATVIVRAHMQPDGYLPRAAKGTISDGFFPITLPATFSAALADVQPLPDDCAF
ncbi:MAG: hypothetical protein AAFO81_12065 [Pseudomonadota bacterium]